MRFYEQKGLLAPARRGWTRLFSYRDHARLRLILRGKRVGFALEEIKEMLDLYNLRDGQATQLQVASVKMRERLEVLRKQRVELEEAIADLERTCGIVDGMLRERQERPKEQQTSAESEDYPEIRGGEEMAGLDVPDPDWFSGDIELLARPAGAFISRNAHRATSTGKNRARSIATSGSEAGALGLLCPSVPESYGGAGGTFAHDAVIAHGATRAGVDGLGLGIALHNSIVTPYLLHYGSEEQKQRWLPKLASGEWIAAIAMTEPAAGSDLQGIRTTARRRGNHYVLNGQKTFITNGQLADLIVVVAKTDPAMGAKGTSLFVVETDRR